MYKVCDNQIIRISFEKDLVPSFLSVVPYIPRIKERIFKFNVNKYPYRGKILLR